VRRTIAVHLGDAARPLGLLRFDRQGAREAATFSYHPTWLDDPERFAIDPALALVAGPQFHRRRADGSVFHAAIADTAPDGWAKRVIQRDHGKRRQEARLKGEETTPPLLDSLAFLLAVDDASRIGALRFRDEEGRFQRAAEPGRRTTPPLIELAHLLAATRAVETNSETAADLAYLSGRGTSLGGLRPKCSVLDEDGRLAIGKFPSVADERPVTRGEVLALRLARRAGIDAAEARLVESDGTPVALIRRFDRPTGGGRLMYVSAATMIGAARDDPGDHSYTELADALRRDGAAPRADIEELWRRIAFSILITNVDDHLLNHGFLHVERGAWRLAPAFDINPFPDRLRELKTWISEDTGPSATIDALMSAHAYFGLAVPRARTILAEVEDAVAGWRDEARALGMRPADLDLFAAAFEHEERDAARRAAAGRRAPG
jgi:serine/threonine-protein kinase HipA